MVSKTDPFRLRLHMPLQGIYPHTVRIVSRLRELSGRWCGRYTGRILSAFCAAFHCIAGKTEPSSIGRYCASLCRRGRRRVHLVSFLAREAPANGLPLSTNGSREVPDLFHRTRAFETLADSHFSSLVDERACKLLVEQQRALFFRQPCRAY